MTLNHTSARSLPISPVDPVPALKRRPGLRAAALLGSLLVTVVLLCSVLLGLTSMAERADAAVAQTATSMPV